MLTDEARAWVDQTAARLRPLPDEVLDELALLLRPAVVAARQARLAPRGRRSGETPLEAAAGDYAPDAPQ